jgi:hypothetical protein
VYAHINKVIWSPLVSVAAKGLTKAMATLEHQQELPVPAWLPVIRQPLMVLSLAPTAWLSSPHWAGWEGKEQADKVSETIQFSRINDSKS